MESKLTKPLQPGQLIARGVARYLRSLGYVSLEEFAPTRGLRVDIMVLGPKGELWIIECKSSRADFNSDSKWETYLEWSDRFFWAVDEDFPTEILPAKNGLIIADAYDADILRDSPLHPVATARRKSLIHKFATKAANRLHNFRDSEFTI
jgi:hypothetical protein